jgi:uncharacterized membrane protein YgdD (TMEM256/DUF423 family)
MTENHVPRSKNHLPMRSPISLVVPAFLGASAVALGAFGAHGLKEILANHGTAEIWRTAAQYHLMHAIACLAATLALQGGGAGFRDGALRWAVRGWLVGVVLFSGSLYGLALSGPKWLGPITPLGGLSFIAGWVCVAFAGARVGEPKP